jgi:hypothetical protein
MVFLSVRNTERVSVAMEKLSAHGFRDGALAGGVAAEAHLLSRGLGTEQRPLNDLDFVVESFASIPGSLAGGFLVHHIHPRAAEGKTLLQLIDPEQGLRIDFFRQFGATLTRTERLYGMTVISLEDVIARTTSLVLGHLRTGKSIDLKHARAFQRLSGLGDPVKMDAAWRDHRQLECESFRDAEHDAQELLARHPELIVREEYSTEARICAKCQDFGPFRRARPETIVKALGYW